MDCRNACRTSGRIPTPRALMQKTSGEYIHVSYNTITAEQGPMIAAQHNIVVTFSYECNIFRAGRYNIHVYNQPTVYTS